MEMHIRSLSISALAIMGIAAAPSFVLGNIGKLSQSDGSEPHRSLTEAVQAAIYGAHADQLDLAAANPLHHFTARFSSEGVELQGRQWSTSWALRSIGYGERQSPVAPARLRSAGTRVELQRTAGLTEWYVNGGKGLEQGFTLSRAPGERRAGDLLRLRMEVAGSLKLRQSGGAIELIGSDGSVALQYRGLSAKDARGRDLKTSMYASGESVWLEVDDAGAAWPIVIDPFFQQAYLKASNTGALDIFGISVAISGDTAAVGAFLESSGATGVNGNQADNSAPDSGAVYVFVRNGGTWTQQAYIKASNTTAGDRFGGSVALSGNTLVVGAANRDANAGAAYVFVRSGTTWTQQAYLKASNAGAGDVFGSAVAISGDTVVVGAYLEDSLASGVNADGSNDSAQDAGAAYVFVRNGNDWSQQAFLKPSHRQVDAHFGFAVAVSGNTIAIGADQEDSGETGINSAPMNPPAFHSGAVYVFDRTGSAWSQQAFVKASNTGATDAFGRSVSLSGDTLAVGAIGERSDATGVNGPQDNDNARGSGAAYVFIRNFGLWTQQAYIKASNTGIEDAFGSAVAISGNVLAVGAPGEDSNATGLNGGQNNEAAPNSGAGYIFVRNGAVWQQQDYVKAVQHPRRRFFWRHRGGFRQHGFVRLLWRG